MIEQASNRSIASNYGLEFSNRDYAPERVHDKYPQGPFWEGPESDFRFGSTVRDLPETFVLTKTHCGARCVKCGADEYIINTTTFLRACERTSYREGKEKYQGLLPARRVVKAVHLIRNPLNNVVSRFHLEARHLNRKLVGKEKGQNQKGDNDNDNGESSKQLDNGNDESLPLNATGFQRYCQNMEKTLSLDIEVDRILHTPRDWPLVQKYRPKSRQHLKAWLRNVPCYPEFVKYVEWHNHVVHYVLDAIGPTASPRTAPALTLYYEDYAHHLNATADMLLEFLDLPLRDGHLREFQMSDYSAQNYGEAGNVKGHYTLKQKRAVALLLRALATTETWKRIRHYVLDVKQ